eukprot:TRINITY_DN31399_c0_g2_i1.p1 TRINITY_DN31399_c0_g2~~TRINITY_DN31399_c0_g2_i1.p1  ORF type:complete len:595 (+),score=79.91 TRINITY_DN31399_c0_g2_i1:86-1870(+)
MFVIAVLFFVASPPSAFVAAAPASGLQVRPAAFLQVNPSVDESLRLTLDASRGFQREIRHAMMSALGCGTNVSAERLLAARLELLPTWFALPKNDHGRVEWRTLRYVGHRHFVHKWSIWVRGFEPSLQVSQSNWSTVDILSQRIPGYVGALLESHHAASHGFSLSDLVYMVVMLEQVILESGESVVKHVYRQHNLSLSAILHRSELETVLRSYLIRWVVADDDAVVKAIIANPDLLESIAAWDDILGFAHGQLRSFDFSRQHHPRLGRGRGALEMRYSLEDVHEIISAITTSFASFWQSECNAAKRELVALDSRGAGRVRLSKFYGNGRQPGRHFVFTDSEAYLRSLGALDESSSLRGKELIIPNYMQSATNCVISTAHYLVCCPDECESILREVEMIAGAASSTPARLVTIIKNLTREASLEEDSAVHVNSFLWAQLEEIASLHNGTVPLHGRLFAQWLHYVFPRDCIFPHKVGSTSTLITDKFGSDIQASEEEMEQHIEDQLEGTMEDIYSQKSNEGLDWTSQWSLDEELFAGRDEAFSSFVPPREHSSGRLSTVGAVVAAVAAMLIATQRLCVVTFRSQLKSADAKLAYFV